MTTTVLDDTFSDSTTVNVSSRNAAVGGAWTAIEVLSGNGPDSARVIGGTGNAYSQSGSSRSGNRSGLVLTNGDWDAYIEVSRPSGVSGSLGLWVGGNTSGSGCWILALNTFSNVVELYHDTTTFAAGGTLAVSAGHTMPTGLSTYQLQKRGSVLRMFREGVQLGADWTDPSPTAAPGVVAFRAIESDNIGVSRVWATIEDAPAGPSFTTQPSNQSVTAPTTASFSAVYTGTIAGHQWQVSTNGGSSWANVSDGTGQSGGSGTGGTLTYTTTATAVSTGNHRNGYQYRCVLNPSGTPVNSNAATLTVNPAPLTITSDPLRDQNNTLLASNTLTRAYAIRISDHTLVANWASPNTNASGVLSLSNAALTAVPHLLVTYTATGLLAGAQVYTPA